MSRTGTIALVVQEAAEIILSESLRISLLIPLTMFLISPFPGAVRTTLLAPV